MSLQQEMTYAEAHQELTRDLDRLWHDAVHDAGRIAIARALGLPFAYSDLIFQQAGGDDRKFCHARIIADMAGAEAERDLFGWSADEDHCPECDFPYSDDRPEHFIRMRRFARQLVRRHRATILRLADQLVAADELGELLSR